MREGTSRGEAGTPRQPRRRFWPEVALVVLGAVALAITPIEPRVIAVLAHVDPHGSTGAVEALVRPPLTGAATFNIGQLAGNAAGRELRSDWRTLHRPGVVEP